MYVTGKQHKEDKKGTMDNNETDDLPSEWAPYPRSWGMFTPLITP